MKKETKSPSVSQPLDKLMRDIERTSTLETRLNRAAIDEIFLELRRNIPYSTQIITATLASKLLADSSHVTTDLTLNTVVVNLGKALFNPDQKNDLEQLVNNYFIARKITEKEYSLAISEGLLQTYSLKEFAERAHPALQQLTHALVEKLINEKQSRKIPGYKPESILEIIGPILHHRIHPEIERVKLGQPQIFRQWLNTIAHEGYEKVSDEKVITIIHKEKETAFKTFKKALNTKFPSAEALDKYLETLRFLQNDRSNYHETLNTLLNDFLKPDMGNIAADLRDRCHERLRKLFNAADKNIAIYRSENRIEAAHAQAFKEMQDEMVTLKKIVAALDTLKKNYSKNFLQAVAGAKNLNLVKTTELDVLLGPVIQINDPQQQKTRTQRVGGYPQRSLAEVLTTLIKYLESISLNISGLFADKLKQEITYAITDLQAASALLKIVPVAPAEKAPADAASMEHEVIPFPTAEPSKPKVEESQPQAEKPAISEADEAEMPEAEPLLKVEPQAFVPAAEPQQAAPAAVVTPLPVQEEPKAEEPRMEEPKVEERKIEELKIEELKVEETAAEDFENFTLEPAMPQAAQPAETLFESDLEDFKLEPPAKPKPEEPKPLLIIEDFDEVHIPEVAAPTAPKTEAASPLEAGIQIMKNYQLGEFEQPILAAWEKMSATGLQSSVPGLLADDNEIKLYVICDLAQQVEAVPEASLTEVNKEILHSVKELLLLALKDPTSEDNWNFFEGPHRDQIDKAIADLRASS